MYSKQIQCYLSILSAGSGICVLCAGISAIASVPWFSTSAQGLREQLKRQTFYHPFTSAGNLQCRPHTGVQAKMYTKARTYCTRYTSFNKTHNVHLVLPEGKWVLQYTYHVVEFRKSVRISDRDINIKAECDGEAKTNPCSGISFLTWSQQSIKSLLTGHQFVL